MKKIFFLYSFLISAYGFSQTYSFDELVTYELKGSTGIIIKTEQRLFNSNEATYFIRFCSDSIVELVDHKSNLIHTYFYKKGKGDDIWFRYKFSDFHEHKKSKKRSDSKDYRIKKISETEYIFGQYRSPKAKNPEMFFRVFLQESDKNQFHLLGHTEPYITEKFIDQLPPNKHFLINKMIAFHYRKEGKTTEIKLITPSDIKIILPEKLVYK